MAIGNYLKIWRNNNGETLTDISKRAKKIRTCPQGMRTSTSFFSLLENNKVKVIHKHLKFLSNVYKINILSLIGFLQEQRHFVVHLPKIEGFELSPFEVLEKMGAKYDIPRFKLENSKASLLLLTLFPHGNTPTFPHLGEEISLVLKNEVYVIFPDLLAGEKERHLKEGDILHFNSSLNHCYENRSNKPSEIFVFRILP